jgi:hypothetical protein
MFERNFTSVEWEINYENCWSCVLFVAVEGVMQFGVPYFYTAVKRDGMLSHWAGSICHCSLTMDSWSNRGECCGLLVWVLRNVLILIEVSNPNFSRVNKWRLRWVLKWSCVGDIHVHARIFSGPQKGSVGLWVRKCSDHSSDCQLLWNDWMTWAAILHEILPKAWRYPSENHEHLTHKGVVEPLQRWPHICGQQTASRWALNKLKWQCHWSSADCGHAGSSYHSLRTCNWGGDKHWIGTLNFGQGC